MSDASSQLLPPLLISTTVHNSDSVSRCAGGNCLSFFSLFVPGKVTSAFGVFRECFDFKGSPLFDPSTLRLGFRGVEWAQKYIKNDTNDTKKSTNTNYATRKQGDGLLGNKDGKLEENQAGRGPWMYLLLCMRPTSTGLSLTAD